MPPILLLRVKFKARLYRLQRWLDGLIPFYCFRCGRLALSRDGRQAQTTIGRAWVKVCRSCHLHLYGEEDK